MKKSLSISIAHRLFNLEEDAYKKLEEYLTSIKTHFNESPDKSEIIADIEERVAEHFLESKTGIITLEDVESLINTMGTVEQFDEERVEGESEKSAKRLYRDSGDAMLAGVASGISHYFGIDPIILRIVFVASLFIGGTGALIYIILWLVMPEAKTASQKLAMHGDPVNLETLSETARERLNEIKEKDMSGFRRVLVFPFKIIGKVIAFLAYLTPLIIRNLFGIILTVAGIVALVTIIVTAGFLTSGDILIFENISLQAFIPGFVRHILTFGLALTLAIPALFALFGGLSLFKKKGVITSSVAFGLLGLWFVALSITGYGAAKIGNRYETFVSNSSAYQEIIREVTLEGQFNALEIRNGLDVEIVQGTTTSMTVEGTAREIDSIRANVENGVLVINRERTIQEQFCLFCFAGHGPARITLTTEKTIESASIVHGSSLRADLGSSELVLDVQHGSSAELSVDAQNLNAHVVHGSRLTLRGVVSVADIALEHGSSLHAEEMETETAQVTSLHGSRAYINVIQALNATARNGSVIYYSGTPAVTAEEAHGSRVQSEN